VFNQATFSAVAPVSLDDIKIHLRLSTTAFDGYVSGLVNAATNIVERYINCPLFKTDWTYFPEATFEFPLVIPKGNVTAVSDFSFRSADGVWHSIDPNSTWDYTIESGRCKIFLRPFVVLALPVLYSEAPFRVSFTAGFGTTPRAVPSPIQHAIKVIVSEMFNQTDGFSAMPLPAQMLLDPFRYWFKEMF